MTITDASALLVRLAGLPVQLWLGAAAPDLFARLRHLEQDEADHRAAGAALAAELGQVLVPHPLLRADERRRVLACRRALHRGGPLAAADLAQVADSCRRLNQTGHACPGDPVHPAGPGGQAGHSGPDGQADLAGLADRLEQIGVAAERLESGVTLLGRQVSAEQRRLLALPWSLLNDSPVGRRALIDASIAHAEDIARRLSDGESWDDKSLRRRSDYLWRMIARAATKTTPRGWLGHVALTDLETSGLGRPRVTAEAASAWVSSVHADSPDKSPQIPALSAEAVVALAPLHAVIDGRLSIWSVPADQPNRLRSFDIRLTPPMLAMHTALAGGLRTAREVIAATLPDLPEDQQTGSGIRLLSTLDRIGVVQEPAPRLQTWATGWTGLDVAPVPAPRTAPGFLDVHRRTTGRWATPDRERLSDAVVLGLRIAALARADAPVAQTWSARLGQEPVPVVRAMAELVAVGHPSPAGKPDDGVWHPARQAGSGYARLLEWIAARADSGAAVIDVTAGLLDALGAPQRRLTWPVDVVLRASDTEPVLDTVGPAGVLDARFVADLAALHGGYPPAEQYRQFLRRLDASTGIASVELLAPPLSARAANAVRRPLYPLLWTGDPDVDRYCSARTGDERYLPLSRLTVRRHQGRVQVETDGNPVRVLYHATRALPSPWSDLARVLGADSPQPSSSPPRLRHPLNAFHRRHHLPRLAVGAIVVAAAQWRLQRTQLWAPRSADLHRLRHLDRLRRQEKWPRWVFVSGGGLRPMACDLESVRAPDQIEERFSRLPDGASLLVEETLPAPDQAAVHDAVSGGRLHAEVMVRLPADLTPESPARRVGSPTLTTKGGD